MSDRLRQGRKVGRTLYEQHGDAPSDTDTLVGMVDTPELAAEICEAVNSARDAQHAAASAPADPVEAAVLTVLAEMHPDVRPQGTGEPLQLAEDARRIAAAVRGATGPRAEAELRALIRDLADPDPCRHDHHGYCQEHGWMETDPPCPHGRAQRLAGEVT